MRPLVLSFFVGVLASTLGCSEGHTPSDDPSYGGRGRVGSTQGSAVVMTYDERVAVAVHRTAGFISIQKLDPDAAPESMLGSVTELDVGIDAKPWAAVIGADDDTAYVLLRGKEQVVRVSHLHDRPALDAGGVVQVGNEPTALAITPSGQRLYVANWANGTVSMITTRDLVSQQRTDLNLILAKTGVLGPMTVDATPGGDPVWSDDELASTRPGLAHPRALAMTDDGDADDSDETLFVTDFFSQPNPAADGTDPDVSRQGLIYPIAVASGMVEDPMFVPAVSTGFNDAKDTPTSCFPNQLYAAAVAAGRLFVTSMCASPRGPIGAGPKPTADAAPSSANFQTMVHPAVFVFDATTGALLPDQSGVLTRPLQDLYDAASPPVAERRMPLIPNDIAVTTAAGGPTAYITAFGADALFPVDYSQGTPVPDVNYVNLRPAGRLPAGVALSSSGHFALVVSDGSDTLQVAALDTRTVAARQDSTTGNRVDPDQRAGRLNFATGLEVWSLKGQAWSSCESCHPEGLSDGVTWQFPRGPRRTISTAGTYDPSGMERRVLLWTANADEVHDVEAIARGTSGGVGGVLWKGYASAQPNKNCRLLFDGTSVASAGLDPDTDDCPAPEVTTSRLNGLNGSLSAITLPEDQRGCDANTNPCDFSATRDWDHIDAFIRSVEAPKAAHRCAASGLGIGPACLQGDQIDAGRKLFESHRCSGCHAGPNWTISHMFYAPGLANNGNVPFAKPAEPATDPADPSALLGSLRTQRYDAGPLADLNGPAKASGSATFRSYAPAAASDTVPHPILDYVYGTADQINCVLRAVGTFPVQPMPTTDTPMPTPNFVGISAPGGPHVDESRETVPASDPTKYTQTLALGKDGFNVPSLTGLAVAGGYYHGGNARTLEEALSTAFSAHYSAKAFGNNPPLTAKDMKALVTFLLSIDDDTAPETLASAGDASTPFNADLCAQFTNRP